MGGLFITDDPAAEPNRALIRPLSFVDGTGYAVFEADKSDASGHLPFNLSADGEILAIYDADLTEIDKVLYTPNMTDASQGRTPDGGDSIQFFDLPTPGVSNASINTTVTTYNLVEIEDVWSYEQSGMDLGPIRYEMDEGTGSVVGDNYGVYDGTLMNMDNNNWVAGHIGSALDFDGVDDYVEISGYKGIAGTASRTCAAWIKTTQTTVGEFMTWDHWTRAPSGPWAFIAMCSVSAFKVVVSLVQP